MLGFVGYHQTKLNVKANRNRLAETFSVVWWTRLQPIRTAAEIVTKIIIEPENSIPVYQKISKMVKELYALGMTFQAIGESLGVDWKTARKAYRYNP